MAKAAYIRLNNSELRKILEDMGYSFSGYGDLKNATNICTTEHKSYSCISDFLLDTKDPYVSWSVCREDCGKDIEKFLELCNDEMYSCTSTNC